MSGPAGAESPVDLESVVLLDDDGVALGIADKATVHHRDTPLHLAFSVYVFDDAEPGAERVLLTRRALHKPTWPGVWTNTCCGHPSPGEPHAEAVRRRTEQELGLALDDLRLVLPRFRYRAVMADGTTENEICPVYAARADARAPLRPDPGEVAEHEWVDWTAFRTAVLAGARAVSPWCVEQVRALPEHPWSAPPAPPSDLPPAAHVTRGYGL